MSLWRREWRQFSSRTRPLGPSPQLALAADRGVGTGFWEATPTSWAELPHFPPSPPFHWGKGHVALPGRAQLEPQEGVSSGRRWLLAILWDSVGTGVRVVGASGPRPRQAATGATFRSMAAV